MCAAGATQFGAFTSPVHAQTIPRGAHRYGPTRRYGARKSAPLPTGFAPHPGHTAASHSCGGSERDLTTAWTKAGPLATPLAPASAVASVAGESTVAVNVNPNAAASLT